MNTIIKLIPYILLITFLVLVLLIIPTQTRASTYTPTYAYISEVQVDVGYTQIEHSWDDRYGYALFEQDMPSIGLTLYNRYNFGFRVAHGFMSQTREASRGNYKNVYVDFKGITSFELLYRYKIGSRFLIKAGIGSYLIPTNHVYKIDGVVVGGKKDRDDDEGYFVEIEYALSNSFGLAYSWHHYSQIGNKEYIKGQSLKVTYKF